MYLICCKILGVNPGSDPETIKAAYRKSAKELHPDVNASEQAHEYFTILQNAYQYLMAHPYTEEEVMQLKREAVLKNYIKNRQARAGTYRSKHSAAERYSLTEVLNHSLTARILYIVFHVLFLSVGLLLIVRSVYDALFFSMEDRTHYFLAYFTVVFGFIFGIVITTIFLYTGFMFIRNR